MIVDAHHHIWDPAARQHTWLDGMPALNRRFSLTDFEQASAPEGVAASVLVQVLASTAETEELLATAAWSALEPPPPPATLWPHAPLWPQAPPRPTPPTPLPAPPAGRVAGVIGWVDLSSPAVADEIARLRVGTGGDLLVGIRHLVQDEPDPDWLNGADVHRGLRAVAAAHLAYDLLVRPRQLPAALAVTGALSDVRFVLDHGAKPEIAQGRHEPWASLIRDLATRPNVSCKVSGLVTEAGPGWRPAQIAPYVDHLLDCFGPERLMFGSDWPVCTLAASYAEVVAVVREALAPRLGPAELDAVFAANTVSAYGLAPSRMDEPLGSL